MPLDLDPDRRAQLLARLQGHWLTEFDEELSAFRAESLLDLVLDVVGPHVYNQAVQDARAYMQARLDDLEGEIYFGSGS